MRRGYPIALLALVVLSGLAVLLAVRSDPEDIGEEVDVDDLPVLAEPSEVPGPNQAEGWINSQALSEGNLAGEVVVYDFWTYSCVNCVRTIPYLQAWYERYHDDGLEIVGVHSPEFEFEKDPANVARAVEDLGVTWPVALDPELAVWQDFGNRYWPAKYVVDREGALRYYHFGEGAYDETEDVLRELLGVDPDSPRADDGGKEADPNTAPPVEQTPELYVGHERGQTASPEGLSDPDDDNEPGGAADFTVPDDLPADGWAFDGQWTVGPESATADEAGAAIVVHYRGSEVNLVLAADATGTGDAAPTAVRVSVDGGEARTIDVTDPDLVNLLSDGPGGDHTLRIEAVDAGLTAYAFTFGA
jgi:thiol-disulfide isomerase/thioredoxin